MKLDTLEPEFRTKVEQVIMGAEIATGLDWVATSCRRTIAEQDKLYAQGRTAKGQIVTKAKGGQSPHNFGLGCDLAPMKDGKIWWTAPDSVWKQMADVAVALGLTAGYYFKTFKDMPHIEAKSWKEVQASWKAGKIQVA